MAEYSIFGLGPEQIVDLPEARWQFHIVKPGKEAWGVDEHRRYDPVKLYLDRDDHHRIKVTWPPLEDMPEDIRWKR